MWKVHLKISKCLPQNLKSGLLVSFLEESYFREMIALMVTSPLGVHRYSLLSLLIHHPGEGRKFLPVVCTCRLCYLLTDSKLLKLYSLLPV
jgi:hypothetical protein